jgi:hypothetical protein
VRNKFLGYPPAQAQQKSTPLAIMLNAARRTHHNDYDPRITKSGSLFGRVPSHERPDGRYQQESSEHPDEPTEAHGRPSPRPHLTGDHTPFFEWDGARTCDSFKVAFLQRDADAPGWGWWNLNKCLVQDSCWHAFRMPKSEHPPAGGTPDEEKESPFSLRGDISLLIP